MSIQQKISWYWACGVCFALSLYLPLLSYPVTQAPQQQALDVAALLADISAVDTAAPPLPARFSTEPADEPVATPAPFVVMIDPGHGGTDQGSTAYNGLLEKELTLDIAQRVKRFLGEEENLEVLMTRDSDYGLSRQNRVNRIQQSGAELVVSLHFNHLPQTDITLVESFYAGRQNILESRALQRQAGATLPVADEELDLSFTEGSARFAGMVQRGVHAQVQSGQADAIDAGAKAETLFVLTRSFVPGALVELTCISNPAEAERLTTEAYRNELAASIADAVRQYRDSVGEHPLGAFGA